MKPDEEIKVRRWECYAPPSDDEDPERGYQRTLREIRGWIASKSWLARGLMAAALLVILAELMLLSPSLLDDLYHLLAGWFLFAWQTFPQIQFNRVSLFNGVLGLVLACILLHWLLSKMMLQKTSGARSWRWRWTVSLAAVVTVMFGICVATVGLVNATAWAGQGLKAPSYGPSRTHNLHAMRNLLAFIDEDTVPQRGTLPDMLSPDDWGPMHFLDGPWAFYLHEDASQPYEFFLWLGSGLPVDAPTDTPILAAPHPYRDGKRLVAFLDESVQECTEEEWQEALARWRQAKQAAGGVNKPEAK